MSRLTPMSTRDVASLLGVSIATVNRRARAGRLPVLSKAPGPRGAFMFDRAEVEALAAGGAR